MNLSDVIPSLQNDDKVTLLHNFMMQLYKNIESTKAKDILLVLYERYPKPIATNELQIKMVLSQYKLYEELARLEGGNFIFRRMDQDDRRVTKVHLSNQGVYVLEQLNGSK